MIVKTPFSTPYRVSTITCNGSINNLDSVDLCGLYENISTIDIGSNKIGFVYISDKDGNNFKGINPKKPKKKDTSGLKKKSLIMLYLVISRLVRIIFLALKFLEMVLFK